MCRRPPAVSGRPILTRSKLTGYSRNATRNYEFWIRWAPWRAWEWNTNQAIGPPLMSDPRGDPDISLTMSGYEQESIRLAASKGNGYECALDFGISF
ncbi:hypothetical protein C8R41DRAFT_357307 [Lentinula lateritia]|uniref:Uncharacterized protein n=1 Tax=Lentinula lateritia TaxID=40482 RepID=A0ABQ8VX02_9AGAR|nr:hypothetical protein C8R41DRAFT_357307 [Lentinula lateritia]